MTPRHKTVLASAAIALIAIAAFLPSLRGEWIYDDHALIERNLHIHSFEHWTRWFTTDFWDVGPDQDARILYWRPLVAATYAVDWGLGGGSPWAFHLSNLVFHALVASLAFVTLRRWTGSMAGAVVGALVFALHPTKAENVAWISGRTDVLCMLGILLACFGLARRLKGVRGGIALEVTGTLIAYGVKEQAIVLPAFVAVEAWVAAGRPTLTLNGLKGMALAALPQTIVAITYLVVRALVLPIAPRHGGFALDVSDRVLTVLETLGHDIVLVFAPHNLSMQQGLVLSREGEMVHSYGHAAAGAAVIVVAVSVVLTARRKAPIAAVGLALFFVTLLPTANIKPLFLETMVSARFLYVPFLGLSLLVAAGIKAASASSRRVVLGLGAAVSTTLLMLSLGRALDFVSERELWTREAELHPESTTALDMLLSDALARNANVEALRILVRRREIRRIYDWREGEVFGFAYNVGLVAGRLTPDLDRSSLDRIDAFAAELVTRREGAASIALRGLQMSMPIVPGDPRDPLVMAQLLGLRAELASRRGDDAAAIELVAEARNRCNGCPHIQAIEAVTLARAGDYANALSIAASSNSAWTLSLHTAQDLHERAETMRGTDAAFTRAREFGALGLWGRAYNTISEVPPANTEQRVLAGEIAYRAGDTTSARAMLVRAMPAAEVNARLRVLADEMGWPPP
jgi:protein O-mannosyl-transferase